ELREHPARRTQRTSLRQKFQDTFSVFWGKAKTGSHYTPTRWGIFDYLTLVIPRLLLNMLESACGFLNGRHNSVLNVLSYVPYILGNIAGIVSWAARSFVAGVATVLVSPVVIVTHFFSWLVGYKQYNKALELKDVQGRTLGTYLDVWDADNIR